MDTKTLEIYWRIQVPKADNEYTSGFRRLLGIGKVIDQHNLWYWRIHKLKLGILEFHLNRKPRYYIKGENGELTIPHR